MIETSSPETLDTHDYGLMLTSVVLLTVGVTLLLFSIAYIRDLQTLANVPNAIWDAICGRPDPESLKLPILMSGAVLAFVASGGVHMWRRLHHSEAN